MIEDCLKAGYPALFILTQEPHRAEEAVVCQNWRFFARDCLTSIREAGLPKVIEDGSDPVHTRPWFSTVTS